MENINKNKIDTDNELWDIVDSAIHKMMYYDKSTGLPNKTLMENIIYYELLCAEKKRSRVALLYMNLDNFKFVNDTVGYSGGNQLLKTVGELIKSITSDLQAVARMGGDEFVFLLPDVNSLEKVICFVNKIFKILEKPLTISEKEFFVTGSIGIAVYPNDGKDFDSLLKSADIAMYNAKELGKNRYKFFAKELNDEIIEKLELDNSLRYAIKNNEIKVFYQPQINLETGKVDGMEALVRWINPKNGIIPPIKFISLAEETGLIIPIGEIVLYDACKQNKLLQEIGYPPSRVAVNLSAKQFEKEDLVETIERILKKTGLEPEWLEIEITESIIMKNFDFAIEMLNKLRTMGIHVSLDDFGTGYSSLNYLKRLPIDTLKIDKSFLDNITEDSNDEIIVKAIIELAHKMNINVVAEGVECFEQLNYLKRQKCDKVQGFLFSKPIPSEEYKQLLKNNKRFLIDNI